LPQWFLGAVDLARGVGPGAGSRTGFCCYSVGLENVPCVDPWPCVGLHFPSQRRSNSGVFDPWVVVLVERAMYLNNPGTGCPTRIRSIGCFGCLVVPPGTDHVFELQVFARTAGN